MIKAFLFAMLFISQNLWAEDYSWLNGNWVGDSKLFVEANPKIKKFDSDSYLAVIGMVESFSWSVQDGFLTSHFSSGHTVPYAYSIRPTDQGFQLLLDDELGLVLNIWRLGNGFCARPDSYWVNISYSDKVRQELKALGNGIPAEGWKEVRPQMADCFVKNVQ